MVTDTHSVHHQVRIDEDTQVTNRGDGRDCCRTDGQSSSW